MTRQVIHHLATLALLALWLAAPPAARADAPAPRPDSIFGVTTTDEQWKNTAAMQALGARWARTSIDWRKTEPTRTDPPTYDWRGADMTITQTLAAGTEPIILLWKNPAWAAPTTCGPLYPEAMDAFARFVQAVTERYDGDGRDDAPGSPVARVFEFYNEPDWRDTTQEWLGGCWGEHGAEYAQLMEVAWRAAHAASPDVVVLNGAVASEQIGDNLFNFDIRGGDFTDDFLAAGGGRFIDGFNLHYYPAFEPRWRAYGHGIGGKAAYYRQRLRNHGIEGLPFYATETGVAIGKQVEGVTITERSQAAFVAKILTQALAADFEAVTWFKMKDDQWGLLAGDGSARRAYQSFQRLARMLGGAAFAGDCSSPAFECHRFTLPDGRPVEVVWSATGRAATYYIAADRVRLTTLDGASRTRARGWAAQQVRITVGSEPLFIFPLGEG